MLDLGTGTGVLAVAAARAAARHVYAIEASGIGRVAQRVFRANGVEDRITLLQGWSSTLSPPEPATVLVSEIVGHDPLDEGVLEHTPDARARLLPRALRVRAYGVRLSPEEAARSTPSAAGLALLVRHRPRPVGGGAWSPPVRDHGPARTRRRLGSRDRPGRPALGRSGDLR